MSAEGNEVDSPVAVSAEIKVSEQNGHDESSVDPVLKKCNDAELASLAIPFGPIENMVLSKKIHQALIEMQNIEDAIELVNYYKAYPITLHGRSSGMQFSRHQRLELHSENTQVSDAIKQANDTVSQDLAGVRSGSPNTILRIIIHNVMGQNITNMILYKIFHRYGRILRMIIFPRHDRYQSLLEFETPQQAFVAFLHLNKQNIFTGCCMLRIAFARNRGPLELRAASDKCRDYTKNPLTEAEEQSLCDLPVTRIGFGAGLYGGYHAMAAAAGLGHVFQNFPTNAYSPAQQPQAAHQLTSQGGQAFNELSAQLSALAQQQGLQLSPQAAAATASFMALTAGGQNSSAFGPLTGPSQGHHANGAATATAVGQPGMGQGELRAPGVYPDTWTMMRCGGMGHGGRVMPGSMVASPHGPPNNNGSTVLMVSNLNEEMVTPDALFTLFGVYGDVTRVKIMFNKKDTALVQFADSPQACTALQHLSEVRLWGKPMRITVSRHNMVQMPREESDTCLTKDYSSSNLHRFRKPNSKNFLNIYAPSDVLHLSNIPLSVSEEEVRELFESHGYKVKGYRAMHQDRRMALIQLESLETALEALIELHNTQLSQNSHLRISFSKSGL